MKCVSKLYALERIHPDISSQDNILDFFFFINQDLPSFYKEYHISNSGNNQITDECILSCGFLRYYCRQHSTCSYSDFVSMNLN